MRHPVTMHRPAARGRAWLAVAVVLLARLAISSPAAGQGPSELVVPPRVELGGGAGLTWYLPTASAVASMPAASWLAVEASASALGGHTISQAQLRIPFASRWRSRRSLVFGFSHVSGGGAFLRRGPGIHIGASFQEPITRRVDLRVDVQQLGPLRGSPTAAPRAVVAFVWHR